MTKNQTIFRQCVICCNSYPRQQLWRFVTLGAEEVLCLPPGHPPVNKALVSTLRRSVYLCDDNSCTQAKGVLQRLSRSLKRSVSSQVFAVVFPMGKASTP